MATRSGSAGSSGFVSPGESAAEREVIEDAGEAGREVSGALEVAGVVSVPAEEGASS